MHTTIRKTRRRQHYLPDLALSLQANCSNYHQSIILRYLKQTPFHAELITSHQTPDSNTLKTSVTEKIFQQPKIFTFLWQSEHQLTDHNKRIITGVDTFCSGQMKMLTVLLFCWILSLNLWTFKEL